MIHDPWSVLGLAPTDDTRAVKRAYAGRLKVTRPDDDPVAFQALSDAYETAMREARDAARAAMEAATTAVEDDAPAERRDSDSIRVADVAHVELASVSATSVAPETSSPTHAGATELPAVHGRTSEAATNSGSSAPAPAPARALPPELPPAADAADQPVATPPQVDADENVSDTGAASGGFDFDAFFRDLADVLRRHDPAALRAWLQAHEALYSIELKWAILPYVFDAVARHAAELEPTPRDLDVLLDFFGVDARLRRHSAVAPALDFLQARGWDPDSASAATASQPAFDALIERYSSRRVPWADRLLLRELLGPRHWLRRLFLMLVPTLPGRLAKLWAQMSDTHAALADERSDGEARAFWARVLDLDRLDPRRLLVSLLRAPLFALPWAWLSTLDEGGAAFARAEAVTSAVVFAGALVGAAGITAMRRVQAFNRDRLHWDLLLATVGAASTVGIVLSLAGVGAGIAVLSGAGFLWLGSRFAARPYVTLFCALVTFAAVVQPLVAVLPEGTSWMPDLAMFLSIAIFVLADVLLARRRRITIAAMRAKIDGLCWATGAAVACMVVAAIVAQALAVRAH